MRHHDDRNSALVQLLKDSHDLDAGSTVEIASRLVRQHNFGVIDQRARDCDALLLAAGELTGMMIFPTFQSN